MKIVILCGGKGERMREFTQDLPKPLVEVHNMPMLWHIMKNYHHFGYNEFIILLGYKGEKIKEFFMNYHLKNSNFVLDAKLNDVEILNNDKIEDFKITFFNTGLDTMTGGRVKQIQHLIGNETFMLTYGDGLSDINIHNLLRFHRKYGKIATVCGIEKTSQYGSLTVEQDVATSFDEKKRTLGIINGGFFVLEPEFFNYLSDDKSCVMEQEPLKNLVKDRQLAVYRHDGFWTAADSYSDIIALNRSENLWKVW